MMQPKELDSLIAAWLDGRLTAEELSRLEGSLIEDPVARKRLRSLANLDVPLRDWAVSAALGESWRTAPPLATKSPVLGFLGNLGQAGWGFIGGHAAMFSVLAALLIVAAAVAIGLKTNGRGSEVAKSREQRAGSTKSPLPASSPVARLTRVADIRWGKGAMPSQVGDELALGQQLHVEAGLAEIVFPKGIDMLLQGPATITVESDQSVFLAEGRVAARLTRPEARGFSVRTPKSNVVDQGTEFGVDLAPGGDQIVHVFQGQVEFAAKSNDGRRVTKQNLTENQGVRVSAETQAVNLVADTGDSFTRSIDKPSHDPHTVAYWRFEDGPVGTLVPDNGQNKLPVRGTLDCSGNGNDLFTWCVCTAPRFSADVAAATVPVSGRANRASLDNSALPDPILGTRDMYTNSLFSQASPIDIQTISPKQWTIEASVKAARLSARMQVFVGRDGSEPLHDKPLPSRLAFSINAQDRFAIEFYDADGRRWDAVADRLSVEKGQWYHVAAASDGLALRLYVDGNDGRGYQLQATTALAATGNTALGVGSKAAEWSICRGKDANGNPAALFQGWIDEVRISDVARQPSEFLFAARHVASGEKGNDNKLPTTESRKETAKDTQPPRF